MSFDLAKLSFNKILIFLAAAKYSNFTAASNFLHFSQPMISRTIAQMEKDFGFPLFIRHKHSVVLTPAGKILYNRFANIVELTNFAYDEAKSEYNHGIKSLCISDLKSRRKDLYLNAIISEFHNQCPEIQFSFQQFEHGTTPEDLLKYNIDIGFFGLSAWSEQTFNTGNSITSELLLTIPQKLYMGCKCPLYDKEEVEISDLGKVPLILCDPSKDVGHQKDNLVAELAKYNITPTIYSYTNNLQATLYSIALSSNACALTDDLFDCQYIQNAKSIPIKGLYNNLYALINTSKANSYTKLFMEITRKHFAAINSTAE